MTRPASRAWPIWPGLAIGIGASVLVDNWRKGPALMLLFGSMAVSFAAIWLTAPDPTRWVLLLMVGVGGANAGGMVLPGLAAYLFPARLLSSAVGMGVLVARLGAFAGPPLGAAMIAGKVPASDVPRRRRAARAGVRGDGAAGARRAGRAGKREEAGGVVEPSSPLPLAGGVGGGGGGPVWRQDRQARPQPLPQAGGTGRPMDHSTLSPFWRLLRVQRHGRADEGLEGLLVDRRRLRAGRWRAECCRRGRR